jgi:VCBS repeat-containing protein
MLAITLLILGAPAALASPLYSPDAAIRLGSGSYVGHAIQNNDASGQSVLNTGLVGQKLTFWIRITNWGALTDSFKVKRSAGFTDGYRVRYYDAANNDVTGRVNTGTFTTPVLATDGAGQYEMRATVKIRSQATLCSFTSRLMTVASVGNSALRDAVRFTAARATPDVNCPPVAVNDKASITENSASVSGNLFANDIDPDGDPISLADLIGVPPYYVTSVVISPATGAYTAFLDNAGPVDALNNGETLTQVIQYSVQDGNGLVSNIATLTITIHGVTDPD